MNDGIDHEQIIAFAFLTLGTRSPVRLVSLVAVERAENIHGLLPSFAFSDIIVDTQILHELVLVLSKFRQIFFGQRFVIGDLDE